MKNILLSFFVLVNFISCKPEPGRTPDKHIYYYLTAEQLAKTPYFTNPAFDTLTFVSNQNDTVVFAKTRVDSGWYRLNASNLSHNYETILYYQQLTAKYQTIKGEGNFEVIHSKQINTWETDRVDIKFNDNTFSCSDRQIGRKTFYTFKDSVEINNRKFKDLIILYSNPDDNTTNEGYLNQSNGLFFIINKIINSNFLLINS
ncbi:MAG: hypothetical protein Q8R57_11895 [Bacteroidota bacterium]|nr:hypothetical protein [Bacteroidota bacterium]